ncbi:hypothetical protein [Eubacterium sp. AM46-8]|jgi:hypothetical protein|uniref:hypothetical protein n=1 Tax=Eubacterium sp. AM46-8 TaxID=2292350 RepID=UPI000E51E35A|nr:hypothetical protein [Eubacterium sp. AM46-8]RGZ89288.1 hypothetical protein DW963_10950 [Eubacterium sp. AM46-8]
MIRRNKIIASVAVSVMTGVLVAGNLVPLQGYYAFAQETGVTAMRYSAVKDINKTLEGYTPIDSSDPVEFGGTYIKYQGETIQLSETAIYLDGSLSDELAAQYPYVYNDITKALSADALKNGTADNPMTVYVAPYVYWIDDPAATDTVQKTEGYSVPYGMVVNSDYLTIKGLTGNPDNVVLAGNRGQSHASNGNYTMFRFNCSGALTVKNITIGNYCSVDLDYPLMSELNQAKRTETITQAQLADVSGEKMFADNCNFISRLNLDPINGASRSLYNNCHFESTDDALNGNAVYVGCDFDFYGNRPLYSSYGTGSTFLGCTFNCKILNVEAEPTQFFTKEGGTITAVDCVYKSNLSVPISIGWTKTPSTSLKCYQSNIIHNGQSITIGGEGAKETVDMTGKSVLDAYKVVSGGKTYYNTYNLLKGSDDWDPLGVKDVIKAAGQDTVATQLSITSDVTEIESGKETASIGGTVNYFYGTNDTTQKITYSVSDEDKAYVKLTDNGDGTCKVEGTNNDDAAKKVIINASTESGLEAAVGITVKPSKLEAPAFTKAPVITNDGQGSLKVDYSLDLGSREDMSAISWYRCTDAEGSNPILVAVTRNDSPEYTYKLTAGDVGYYIMAKVESKNIRSDYGTPVNTVYDKAIGVKDIRSKNFATDFSNFPNVKQSEIKAGFWTVDYNRPADTESFGSWQGADTEEPWKYGTTGNGCVGAGLYEGTQGARLMYTPVEGTYGDMSLKLVVDPAKTAGQGFGSAGQYMDVLLKFDTSTLTGYGLRIVRTKASSNAVTFVLVKYDNGTVTEISDEVIASCYATGCTISLKAEGNKLTAHVETPTEQLADQAAKGYPHVVDLTAEIEANSFGGVAIQHTGTLGARGWQNTTMLHNLNVTWEGENNQNPEYVEGNPSDNENPAETPDDSTGTSTGADTTVKTGDMSHTGMYAALMSAGLCGLLGMAAVYMRRRKDI